MKIKRVIAAFMAAAICGSLAVSAGAEEIKGFTVESYGGASVESDYRDEKSCTYNDCYFEYFDGVYCWLNDHNGCGGRKELSIPAEIDGIPVTGISIEISLSPHCGSDQLEKLYIPSSVKNIYVTLMWDQAYPLIYAFPKLTDVYFEGTEAEWYNAMTNLFSPHYPVETGSKWDGKFSKDSNWAYDGIENVTLHVNCKDINDEGDVVNFGAKAEKPAKVSGIKKDRSKTYIKLSWNKSKDAESYVIKYSTDKKTWKTKTVKTNSVKLSKLKAGTKYYIKVAAKNSSGTGAYSKVFSVTTKK